LERLVRQNTPPSSLEKIRCNEAFTNGKKCGHGLGLTQVKETLKKSGGLFSIDSTIHSGTSVTLKFPKIKAPFWLPNKIQFSKNTLILILDEDPSVHEAWKIRLRKLETMAIRNFMDPIKAMKFIETLEDKSNALLLADYHLSHEINGVEIIKKSGIKRSILVTTNYADESIIRDALFFDFKILPKSLLHSIQICMEDPEDEASKIQEGQSPDLIIIDDNKSFVETLIRYKLG
jgi:hypothetical protein